ncbi:MAG: dTDP-glucose 4,6-dehydratase [Myxococcales bacterium]|jgi:dTDP-glucose 4,6-dehydratase|nr:dTDP-glucose 4,6-dehydratase [Myxococcales bacterium]
MRILVTGGAGFIGSNLLHRLVPRHPEHHFLNLDALTYAANPLSLEALATRPNYELVEGNIADPELVHDLVDRYAPDWILHLAAESHVDRSIVGPAPFITTNVLGTFHLLEACRRLQERQRVLFHHVSTDEVYGSLGEEGAFTEESRYDPSSPYSASKAASDHLVRAYHRTYGLAVKLTNSSNNYGPYQAPEKLIPRMIHNALRGVPLPVYGDGLNVRDWLFVEDHCEALWEIALRGEIGATYNVGGGCEVRNVDLVRSLCRVLAEELGRPPEELLNLVTFVADRPGHDHRYALDASKLRRELGWAPRTTFAAGLRRTVRWYLEHQEWVRVSAERLTR